MPPDLRHARAEPTFPSAPSPHPEFTPEDERAAYRDMLLIRRFEEKAGQLYGMGHIGGFCHLYIGQEAVATGIAMARRAGDQIIAAYRHHGHMLAAGIDARPIMAELLGRAAGISSGKGGSMHMFAPEHGFYGGHGIVGAQVPIGAGLALANRYRGGDGVCWCFLGDGAASQGQVYETMNMATLWRLPVIFVIENDTEAGAFDCKVAAAGTGAVGSGGTAADLSQRGRCFSIPGWQVDGMDVRAVRDAALRAAAWSRAGNGPFILEMLTERYRGHSMADPAKYQARDEAVARRAQQDPISLVKERLLAHDVSEAVLRQIDKDVRAIVAGACAFALDAPEPVAGELQRAVVVDA